MRQRVQEFVTRRWSVPAGLLDVEIQPLHGGLESAVATASVSEHPRFSSVPRPLVVKELRGACRREAKIYAALWRHLPRPPAARLLGVQARGDTTYLYLEAVRTIGPWPWADTALASAVCRALAYFHDSAGLPRSAFSWSYDAGLKASAETTLDLAIATKTTSPRPWCRLGDLRRVVAELPAIRARLRASGTTVIHGDVHPGNVLLRCGSPEAEVALIDWARARIGSPLEDVASWLHSLGCWEPQARRRHDTLMRAYLDSRLVRRPFESDLREAYWFASVSNGLAGAIRYHLSVLADRSAPPTRQRDSAVALAAWERVVRRAAALLSTSRRRRT